MLADARPTGDDDARAKMPRQHQMAAERPFLYAIYRRSDTDVLADLEAY